MAKDRKYRKRDSSSESSNGAAKSDPESDDEVKKEGKRDKEGDKEERKDKHKKHKRSHKSEERDRDRDRSRDRPRQRSRSRDRDRRDRSRSRERRHADRGSPRRRGDYDRDRDRRGGRDDYGGRRPRSRSPPGDRYRRRSRSQERGDRDRDRDGRREGAKPVSKPPPGRNAKLLDYINAEKAQTEGGEAAAGVVKTQAKTAGFLGGMLMTHDRINERMDKRERAAAEERLRQLNTGVSQAGKEIRDGYARGVKADVVKAADLPYKCTECRKSFPTAPSLSDHLKVAHNIRKHPSQIYQTASKPALGGGAADD